MGKGGVVRDPALHRSVIERVLASAAAVGWPRGRGEPLSDHRTGWQCGVSGVDAAGRRATTLRDGYCLAGYVRRLTRLRSSLDVQNLNVHCVQCRP